MRLLIAGTSHGSALRLAQNAGHPTGFDEVCYCLTTGGNGPSLSVAEDGRLAVFNPEAGSKTIVVPADVLDRPVGQFDAVLVSALGASFATSSNADLHPGVLHRFGARTGPLISEAMARAVLFADLDRTQGVRFVRALATTGVRIVLQPTPLLSESVAGGQDWALGKLYEDSLGAHLFYNEARNDYLQALAREIGATLLPYPRPEWPGSGFTPSSLMQADNVHGNDQYGALVFEQAAKHLAR